MDVSEPRPAGGDVVIDSETRTREAVADALRRVGPPDTRPAARPAGPASDARTPRP
jgi:hypothetical protein